MGRMNGTWRFKCKLCGMFGRGDKSLAHYMAMRHEHNYVEVWPNGGERKHVAQSDHRGKGIDDE